jgi:hypothetical protein
MGYEDGRKNWGMKRVQGEEGIWNLARDDAKTEGEQKQGGGEIAAT